MKTSDNISRSGAGGINNSMRARAARAPRYRTDGHGANTTHFPWRYPGKAPVVDACGVTGGGVPPLGQVGR